MDLGYHIIFNTTQYTHIHTHKTVSWPSDRDYLHPLTFILIIRHPLSISSIYYDL